MEDNNYGIPVIEQTDVCCQRCGSMNITYQREQIGSTGTANTKSKTRIVSLRKVKGKAQTITTYNTLYQTTAVCNNCGNTWITAGGLPKKPEKKALTPLEIAAVIVLVIAIIGALFLYALFDRSPKRTTTAAVETVSLRVENHVDE